MNMVGTPLKMVTRSRSITSSTLVTSKRGTRVSVPPKRITTLATLDSPNTWKRGRTPMPTSSRTRPKRRPPTSQFM